MIERLAFAIFNLCKEVELTHRLGHTVVERFAGFFVDDFGTQHRLLNLNRAVDNLFCCQPWRLLGKILFVRQVEVFTLLCGE